MWLVYSRDPEDFWQQAPLDCTFWPYVSIYYAVDNEEDLITQCHYIEEPVLHGLWAKLEVIIGILETKIHLEESSND